MLIVVKIKPVPYVFIWFVYFGGIWWSFLVWIGYHLRRD